MDADRAVSKLLLGAAGQKAHLLINWISYGIIRSFTRHIWAKIKRQNRNKKKKHLKNTISPLKNHYYMKMEHRLGYGTQASGLSSLCFYLKGFPWLNPKLELTIMATQNAMKRIRKRTSLHFLFRFMIPSLIWVLPSLDGYLPITAPKGPFIRPSILSIFSNNRLEQRERERWREGEREGGSEGQCKWEVEWKLGRVWNGFRNIFGY